MRSTPTLPLLRLVGLFGAFLFLGGAACFGDPEAGNDAGTEREGIAVNCGFESSTGNEIGMGKYCHATAECPTATEGTTIQCSTVLTSDTLPLLCSRICGDIGDGGTIDCGEGAVCHNIIQLGYDLLVCVPNACESLFDGGLPDGG